MKEKGSYYFQDNTKKYMSFWGSQSMNEGVNCSLAFVRLSYFNLIASSINFSGSFVNSAFALTSFPFLSINT